MKIMVRTMDVVLVIQMTKVARKSVLGIEEMHRMSRLQLFDSSFSVAKNSEERNMFLFSQQKNVITGRGEKML